MLFVFNSPEFLHTYTHELTLSSRPSRQNIIIENIPLVAYNKLNSVFPDRASPLRMSTHFLLRLTLELSFLPTFQSFTIKKAFVLQNNYYCLIIASRRFTNVYLKKRITTTTTTTNPKKHKIEQKNILVHIFRVSCDYLLLFLL